MSAVQLTARFVLEASATEPTEPRWTDCAGGEGAVITTSEYEAAKARIDASSACRYVPGQLVKLTIWWLDIAGSEAVTPFGYFVALM